MILPAVQDRGGVVFHLFGSLPYEKRLSLSFGLIVLGLLLQLIFASLLAGICFIAAGNLLLLVRGYDNRVDRGKYDPWSEWERVETKKLDELSGLDRRIRKWDISTLDVTNLAGLIVFLVVAGLLGYAAGTTKGLVQTLAIDGLVLLLPHWITGVRSILRKPHLTLKVQTIRNIFQRFQGHLRDHRVTVLMLLEGKETRIPADVKFKVEPKDRHPDFLGLYGQVVLNDVQGKSYPYFYVVLVARKDFGMRPLYQKYDPPHNITKEFKVQEEVEVMVIRQTTTRKSGYHTNRRAIRSILLEGLRLAGQVSGSPQKS